MSKRHVEQEATSSSSSESPESINSDLERQHLLTDINPSDSNYKSTDIVRSDVSYDEENGTWEEELASKSVLAIISLLLIGRSRSLYLDQPGSDTGI